MKITFLNVGLRVILRSLFLQCVNFICLPCKIRHSYFLQVMKQKNVVFHPVIKLLEKLYK